MARGVPAPGAAGRSSWHWVNSGAEFQPLSVPKDHSGAEAAASTAEMTLGGVSLHRGDHTFNCCKVTALYNLYHNNNYIYIFFFFCCDLMNSSLGPMLRLIRGEGEILLEYF